MARRVLFLTQTQNAFGGMEQWVHNFTLWLQAQPGWEVKFALPRGRKFNDPETYRRAHPHIDAMELDVRVGTESARVRAVVDAIERYDPDILIPIGSGTAFPAVVEAKRRGSRVRFLPTVRGVVPELIANIVDFWPSVDGVVSISRFFQSYFEETLPAADAERVHYVRHGARPAFAGHIDAPALRAGYVGRITREHKRIGDLIAFGEAIGSEVELHVYGGGPAEAEVRERLPHAVFHGVLSQDELYRTGYPNLDVLLLFSEVEGTPNAVCEALHHGVVPVMARYFGASGERFVIDGRNGFTFAVGDVASAVEHVRALAADRPRLRAMGEEARRSIAHDTDLRMHRDWVRIFEQTLAMPPRGVGGQRVAEATGGRLDRILPAGLADRIRAWTGRQFPHPDGWAEWPGSVPVSAERRAAVMDALVRLDRAAMRVG